MTPRQFDLEIAETRLDELQRELDKKDVSKVVIREYYSLLTKVIVLSKTGAKQ